MADTSWLRLLAGPRSKTPARGTSPPAESSSNTATLQQHNHNQQKQDVQQTKQLTNPDEEVAPQKRPHGCQSKALSRLPSWPALSQASSTSAAPKSTTPDLLVREADRVAHEPSMDHIVDTLLAAVMSKPTLEPLGPEYGSSILHLIEAYRTAKKELLEAQNQVSQAVARRQKQKEGFETLVTEWTIQEARYKAEIKRLELIIHRTSDSGLEAVSMARSGSLVGRGTRKIPNEKGTSPDDLETQEDPSVNCRRITTDHNVSNFDGPAPRHRYSLIGRPRILDPGNDVTLSRKIDQEPSVDNVPSIISAHGTARGLPSTVSPEDSSSSSSSDAQRTTKRPSDMALKGGRILTESSNLPKRNHSHPREFSFAAGEDSMVTQHKVNKSYTHSKSEVTTTKSPHTPLMASLQNEGQSTTTSLGVSTPVLREAHPDGMEHGPLQLCRSREARSSDVSVARSTSTVKHIPRESLDGKAHTKGM